MIARNRGETREMVEASHLSRFLETMSAWPLADERERSALRERTGSSPEFEAVLARFHEVALRAGAAHGVRGDDLDEVLQDVRIRLWRAGDVVGKLETLTPAYVYRAASSAALDLIRRRRARREQPMSASNRDDWAPYPSPSVTDDAMLTSETLGAIARAIESLAPNRRAVVRMYLAGYDREEIGDLLRWSEAKTRNLLYRGLDDLRRLLTAQGIGPGATA